MHPQNSQQHKLLDSTAVAENRITGGVGEVTGEIPLPRPDLYWTTLFIMSMRNISQ